MSESNKTYTYRGGQKVELEKSSDQMVVRTLPDQLDDAVKGVRSKYLKKQYEKGGLCKLDGMSL